MSRHDDTMRNVLRLLRQGKNGEPGVAEAMAFLREEFVKAVGADRAEGETEAEKEFDRMVIGAEALVDDEADVPEILIPMPLDRNVPVPLFPIDCLPPFMADMVRSVSESTQTDLAMAATAGLSALSVCTGGHVEVKIRNGWNEPLHLYIVSVAAPGERKSAVQRAMVGPIYEVETELIRDSAARRVEAETTKKAALKWAEKQHTIAAGTAPESRREALASAIEAMQAAEAVEVPPVPKLIADDITPEAVASALSEQAGRLAILSAEGGLFDIIWGRYSQSPNMDIWLKGHSGDPVKVDRKGRDPEYVRRPAVTVGLMIQPTMLATIGATRREFRGRGLLARFLYARPVSKVGRRKIAAPPLNEDIAKAYDEALSLLTRGLAGWSGDPAILTLTQQAEQTVAAIEAAVEPTLAGDGELAELADWGAKYVGAVVRIAGILHMGTLGAEGFRTEIDHLTVEAAARIGSYFKACAINTFAEIGMDNAASGASYLLDRIHSREQDEMSERDIHVLSRRRFPTKADLAPALARLIETGWLIKLDDPAPTGGRRASTRYKVYRTQDTQDTQR